MSRLEIFKAASKREGEEEVWADWRWRLRADNGEIVAQSEGHTRREDAERGAVGAREAMKKAQIEHE